MVAFFEYIIHFLEQEKIPYMLTGSMAMSVYVIGRSTQDFDFVIQLSSNDIPKIVNYFKGGFYCDEDSIKDALRRKSMFNIIDHITQFKADFIMLRDNEYQQMAFSRRSKVDILGVWASVISAEDLIVSKLIWIQQLQRGRQLEDIKAMSKNPNIDWNYIHHWIAKLNLSTFDVFKND